MDKIMAVTTAMIGGLALGVAGLFIFEAVLGKWGTFLALPIGLATTFIILHRLWPTPETEVTP